MDYIEKEVKKNYVYHGKIINLRCDDALLPNGQPCKREIIEHSGGACVLYVEDGKVLLVRQYRYAIGKAILEIPAGKLDSINENPDDAVRRELREETGAISGNLTYLGLYYGSPALLSEKIYMYLAENLSFGDCDPDDDEFLEIVKIPLSELVDMVLRGEIEDGKTQAAVLRAHTMISRR